jgi:hypothetical protein
MAETRNAYEILVRKPKGRICSGTPMVRWEGDIKMLTTIGLDFAGSGYGSVVGWCGHGNGYFTSMKDLVSDS